MLGPVRIVVQAVSVVLFVMVWVSALLGDTDPFRNLAPTWIYVIFWLGVPALSVLLGNVWRGLSPWRAIADLFVWLRELGAGRGASARRVSGAVRPLARVRWCSSPSRRWSSPTPIPSSPRALAFAIAVYTYVALFGMARVRPGHLDVAPARGLPMYFGSSRGSRRFIARDGRIRLRLPLDGPRREGARRRARSRSLAVMLGTVVFDGYCRTTTWQDLMARLEGPYVVNQPGTARAARHAARASAGSSAAILIVALAYPAACAIARWTVNAPRSLVPDFVLSLVPIAFVYVVAHYVTLFLLQGQYTVPLLSDPLGQRVGSVRHGARAARTSR